MRAVLARRLKLLARAMTLDEPEARYKALKKLYKAGKLTFMKKGEARKVNGR